MSATGGAAIVVGAGIFGTTSALELASRGWKVRLMDPGPLPRPEAASTDISKLVRADYGADGFYTALAERAMEGWEEWNRRWDGHLYHQDGLLVLSEGRMEPGSFEHESHRTLTGRGRDLRPLDPATIRRDHPAWAKGRLGGGYFNPGAGWVESGRSLGRLVEEARVRGVRVESGRAMERLVDQGDRGTAVRTTDGTDHRADVVVVAAGAWTPSLLPDLREVMWATGQPVLHLHVENPALWQPPVFPPWTADIARTGWYGFPALDDGTLKIGHHGAGRRVDPDGLRIVRPDWEVRCRDFLAGALPDLADRPIVRTRLCLYCDTFDGDFWIDRHPERQGVVVAAGGSGHGFKFAPLLGEVVADVVEERNNPWAHRFRWRPPGRERTEAARAGESG